MLEKLPQVDRDFIKSYVEQGFYASEIEVVRDAVRRLRERAEDRRSTLHALLQEAEESIAQGKSRPYSRELLDQLTKNGIEKAARGDKIANHVLP